MILGCDDCGENLPYVEIDGSSVGDGCLEVTFHFFENRSVRVRDEDAKLAENLDRRWLKRIQQGVLDGEFDTICPKCKKKSYVEE
jgi:predicted PP-loop superfamily ATPase